MSATRTPRIQALGILVQIQSALAIMSIHNGRAFMLGQLLLLVVPELLPRRARVLRAGDAGLEVDGAHVHDVHWVLVFERCVGDEAGVHGDEGAEVRDGADAQDDGA